VICWLPQDWKTGSPRLALNYLVQLEHLKWGAASKPVFRGRCPNPTSRQSFGAIARRRTETVLTSILKLTDTELARSRKAEVLI